MRHRPDDNGIFQRFRLLWLFALVLAEDGFAVQVLTASSRSPLDGDLPFFPVVQSAAAICRLWCVSLPYQQLDTNLMPKRGSDINASGIAERTSVPRTSSDLARATSHHA
jgi:hypothetical protein